MISIQNFSHRYSRTAAPAVELEQWSVSAGTQGCVLGPSGSGKTTLLSVLAGLIKPSQGQVSVDGVALGESGDLSDAQRDAFRAQRIGLVTQQAHFVRPLNMRDNLRLALDLAGQHLPDSAVLDIAQRLNIAHRLNAKPHELSTGEAQRFSVARAVLHKPKVVLADEPTSALDDDNAASVTQLLRDQASTIGATLVVVTHDHRVTQHLPVLLRLSTLNSSAQEHS
jgi:putative ABC transport system ATP-binding protein